MHAPTNKPFLTFHKIHHTSARFTFFITLVHAVSSGRLNRKDLVDHPLYGIILIVLLLYLRIVLFCDPLLSTVSHRL